MDDVVAESRECILMRDFSGMRSFNSAKREERGADTSAVDGVERASVDVELAPLLGCAGTFRSVVFITSDGTAPLSVPVRSTFRFALFETEETSRTSIVAVERVTGAVFIASVA